MAIVFKQPQRARKDEKPLRSSHFWRFKIFLGLLLSLFAFSGNARAWWNGEWTVRKKITLDAKAGGVDDFSGSAAVLIRLHDGDFQFAAAKEDGGDLRFVAADDKTLLAYHIEKFDALLGEAFVWVKLEVKPGEPLTFWLYYGNDKATKADDAKATYDAETTLVYHFAENGAPANDFTMSGNNAQNAGVPVDGAMIGGGVRFDGQSGIAIAAAPNLAWTENGSMTWSAWIKPGALAANALIFSRRDGDKNFLLGLDNGVPFVKINNQRSPSGAPLAVGSWHHLAAVASGAKTELYLDGEFYGALNNGLILLNTPLQLGSEKDVANGFAGELDELRLDKVARPAAFLKFLATEQDGEKAAKLLVLDADEQPTGIFSWLESGTFGVIIKSLTFDGWVVIGVLGIMFVVSWSVMISKARYLGRITKANTLFTREWRKVESDPKAIEEGVGAKLTAPEQTILRQSPLYRVYTIGAESVRHRLSLRPEQPHSLTARGIQAIRARLDGGQVIETERINSKIVLLTIAISGGPFLGLLGTVVGVMITFAAVAAAGEVNVNAIAPGIAAALLATVAGLAVAIPSLFGYNYLLARIKAANTALHVFIDEFVTSMAEHYRGGPAE